MKCAYLPYLPLTLSAFFAQASVSLQSSAEVTGIQAMQTKVIGVLSEQRQTIGTNVLFSASDCYSKDNELSLPLAPHLRDLMVSALEQNGFKVIKPDVAVEDAWVLSCRWKRKSDKLAFTFMATPWTGGKRGEISVLSVMIPASEIEPHLLQPDMASYARTLIRRLAKNERTLKPWRVYIRPVEVSGVISGKACNAYFNQWMRQAVQESNVLIPVDAPIELAQLSTDTLRLRGIRPRPKLSLTSDLLAVERQIKGNVSADKQAVEIEAELISKTNAIQPISASVQIPFAKLPRDIASEMFSKRPKDQAIAQAPTSLKGLNVELATSRGEGTAIYRDGAKIQFLVRVNRPAYVYLFDLNSKGEAVQLYPALGVKNRKLSPDKLLLLPDDGMPYELVVSPPYGKDLVWAIASETALDLPEKMEGDWTKAEGLQKRLWALSEATPRGFAEAQLVVHTIH